MEVIKLISRTKKDGNTRSILNNNLIPCVVYGKNFKPQSLSIDSKIIIPFIKEIGFYSKIFSVELNGRVQKILPKEVQFNPVNDKVIHVDFMCVQDNTKVNVEIAINFLNRNICPGIKQGGVLNSVRRFVELSCSVNKIPAALEFDLKETEIGDSIKISNINLPEGVKPTIIDRDFVIATLAPPTIEIEEEKAEEKTEETEGETEKTEGEDDKKADKKDGKTEQKEDATDQKKDKKEDPK